MINQFAKYCLLLSPILVLWSLLLPAQPFHFTLFDPQDGLCSPEITTLYQDSKGQLWVGTTLGLNVYDGYEFHNISLENGLPTGKINDIEEDTYGAIWVAMEMGLGLIKNRQIVTWGKRDSLFSEGINQLYMDVHGNLWLGSPHLLSLFPREEIEAFHRNEWEVPTLKHFKAEILSEQIYDLEGDEKGNLYIGTFTSLLRFNHRDSFQVIAATGERLAMPTAIVPLGKDRVLWSVYDGNIYQYSNGKPDTLFLSPHVLINQEILELDDSLWGVANGKISQYTDGKRIDSFSFPWKLTETREILISDSAFWVTFGGGLCAIRTDRVDVYPTPPNWELKYFTCGLQDQEGNFWLGSTEGLVKASPKKFRFYQSADGFSRDLYSMKEEENGRLIIGGNQGQVFVYDNGNYFKPYEIPDVLPVSGEIFDILKDHKGNYWFASYWRGLTHLKNGKPERYLCRSDIDKCIDLNCIYEDWQQNMWVGTWMGMTRIVMDWEADTIEQIIHYWEQDKPEFVVNTIVQDKFGTLWFGTDKGLFYFDHDNDRPSLFPLGIEIPSITELKTDQENHLWMTTQGTGIIKCKITGEGKLELLQQFTNTDGLASDFFLSLELDDSGNVWVATYQGISVLKKSGEGYHIINYNAHDGLIDKAYQRLRLYKDSKGRMWGLSTMGLFSFEPEKMVAEKKVLETAITKAAFSGIEVDLQDMDTPSYLPWNRNMLEVEFRAINLSNPSKIQYSWHLEGLDEDWSAPGNTRSLRFNNLLPGRYAFQVKVCNPDGFWNEQPTTFAFVILSPWWATWWAYLSYILLALTLVFAFYFYKKREWQLQAQLALEHREAERLKELDVVKTKLYTNITHEFRTPLTVILGMVRQIKENPQDWFNEGLKMIERNGNNLLQLVNQMLNLSKLESGALPVNLIQGDILTYLKYVLESFHSMAESKNVQLHFQSDSDELIMDYDPEKIREIVSNLLSNAIKFTPEGGAVNVRLTAAGQRSTENPMSLPLAIGRPLSTIITIKDTGIGIAPEKLPHIFDRFYQADDASTRKTEGTGIGLALTKELVKLLKGEISVESGIGMGTVFTIELPLTNNAPLSKETGVVERPESILSLAALQPIEEGRFADSKTQPPDLPILLIVEDNADVAHYLKSILAKDYRMEMAINGQQGLGKALELVPDIIISDVMMPIMDGFELCEKLKKDTRTSHIPIILLTAKADISSKIEGLEHGADAYLAKPFHKEELLVRLQKLMELRKCLQERYAVFPLAVSYPPSADFPIEDAFLQKVHKILEIHLGNEYFSILDLCKELGMSRTQLYRKFKALTNQPIGHFFRSMRLQKAKELLLTTDLHISEIAYEVGFKSPAYFTRIFKEEFGVNPSKVRSKKR